MRFGGVETEGDSLPYLQGSQSRTATAPGRREVRFANFGRQVVLRQRRLDPRLQLAAIRLVVGVLELTPATLREMPAGRLLMMRTERQCAIVQKSITRNGERHMLPG